MAVIYLDELNSALNFSTFDTLATDRDDTRTVSETLDSFMYNTYGELKGEEWNSVRTKLGTYYSALQTRLGVAQKLSEAIQQALNLLKDYIGDYESLDTSKLEEIKAAKSQCEADIATLQAMLRETRREDILNDEGEVVGYSLVPVYNAGVINNKIGQIQEEIKEFDKLIAKIEGLEEVYKEAETILETAFSEIDSFGTAVNAIVPSDMVTFTPPVAESLPVYSPVTATEY